MLWLSVLYSVFSTSVTTGPFLKIAPLEQHLTFQQQPTTHHRQRYLLNKNQPPCTRRNRMLLNVVAPKQHIAYIKCKATSWVCVRRGRINNNKLYFYPAFLPEGLQGRLQTMHKNTNNNIQYIKEVKQALNTMGLTSE